MRRMIFISPLLLFLCISSFGMAFDNHRRGFIIGGLGGATLNIGNKIDYDVGDVEANYGTNVALHLDFRLGGGFKGDKFMLYFWNVLNRFDNETLMLIGRITGIGVSYYFKPTTPSFYFNAGFGRSAVWISTYGLMPFLSGIWYGFGYKGGIGYEIRPHLGLEVGIMYTRPEYEDYENGWWVKHDTTNVYAITLGIIGIAY